MCARRSLVLLASHLALAWLATGCCTMGKVDYGEWILHGRDGWQHPGEVIRALGLEPGDRVAEIGAGDGYWLPWLSEAVGEGGRVYAVEVDAELARALADRVTDDSLANVVVVLGEYAAPKLPDGGIDVAMTCLTYHHIEDREAYFERLRVDLAPGGRVVHLDDHPDVPFFIRWMQGSHVSEPDAIVAEMETAGYARTARFDFLPFMSFQQFEPAPDARHESDLPR